jgi:hypothetical protein
MRSQVGNRSACILKGRPRPSLLPPFLSSYPVHWPPHAGEAAKREMQEQDVDVLNQRLAEARQSEVAGGGGMAAAEAPEPDAAAGEEGQPSFLKSTDEEVASALADRIAAMAAVQGSGGGDGGALTGPLLKELLLSKWGKAYDLSFVRRDPPLGKTLICLNVSARVAPRVRWASHMCSKGCACGAHRNSCALWIAPFLPLLHNRPTSHLPQVMWTHLEQRSFPMTEEEYDEKLDLMALYLKWAGEWGAARGGGGGGRRGDWVSPAACASLPEKERPLPAPILLARGSASWALDRRNMRCALTCFGRCHCRTPQLMGPGGARGVLPAAAGPSAARPALQADCGRSRLHSGGPTCCAAGPVAPQSSAFTSSGMLISHSSPPACCSWTWRTRLSKSTLPRAAREAGEACSGSWLRG